MSKSSYRQKLCFLCFFFLFFSISAIYYSNRSSWDILKSLLFVRKEETKMFNNQKFLTRGVDG